MLYFIENTFLYYERTESVCLSASASECVSLPELLELPDSAPLPVCKLREHSLSCSDADSAPESDSEPDAEPDAESDAESDAEPDAEPESESDAREPCDQLLSEASELPEASNTLGLHCVAPGESGAVCVRRRLPGIAMLRASPRVQKVAGFFIFTTQQKLHPS